jgi:hypothetical protein
MTPLPSGNRRRRRRSCLSRQAGREPQSHGNALYLAMGHQQQRHDDDDEARRMSGVSLCAYVYVVDGLSVGRVSIEGWC